MVVFILINSLNGYPDHTLPCKKVLKPLCTKAFLIHCSQARSVWQTAPPPKTIRQGRELVRNFRLFSRNFPLPTCTNSTFCLFAIIWRDSSGAQVTFLRWGGRRDLERNISWDSALRSFSRPGSFSVLTSGRLLGEWELILAFPFRRKYRTETSTEATLYSRLFNSGLCREGSSGQVGLLLGIFKALDLCFQITSR